MIDPASSQKRNEKPDEIFCKFELNLMLSELFFGTNGAITAFGPYNLMAIKFPTILAIPLNEFVIPLRPDFIFARDTTMP